jgi:hypothetical protein
MGKKWKAEEEEIHKGSLTQKNNNKNFDQNHVKNVIVIYG